MAVLLIPVFLLTACAVGGGGMEEDMTVELRSGDKAPLFKLKDQTGKIVNLKDYRGQKVLIYFYPRASTPGCTVQACSVRDAADDFSKVNVPVFGISPDKPEAQAKFDTNQGLGFPLLSDEDKATAKAYGVYKKRLVGDKLIPGINRSSFLIGEDGLILEAWYGISPKDTVPEALAAIARHSDGKAE